MISAFINNLTWALIVPGIALGVLLLLAGKVLPSAFTQFKLPAQLAGIVLVLFFTFQSGRFNMNEELAKKNKEQEIEIALLYASAGNITTQIQTEYITETKIVEKWREVKIPYYIPAAADAACRIDELAPKFRELINNAAKGVPPPVTP